MPDPRSSPWETWMWTVAGMPAQMNRSPWFLCTPTQPLDKLSSFTWEVPGGWEAVAGSIGPGMLQENAFRAQHGVVDRSDRPVEEKFFLMVPSKMIG